MKRLVFFLILFLFSGCAIRKSVASVQDYGTPKEDIVLSSIYVYIGDLSLGESGPSAEGGITLKGINSKVMLTAWGMDLKRNYLWVDAKWSTNLPEVLKIEPETGSKVILTALKKTYGNIELYVEAYGVKRTYYVFISE